MRALEMNEKLLVQINGTYDVNSRPEIEFTDV